jgi:hypothetical protein
MPVELAIRHDDLSRVELQLGRIPSLVTQALQDTGDTLRNVVRGRTPVGIRPPTGGAKGSWSEVQQTANGYSFSNPVDYTYVLEEGRYPGVGPRTVAQGGGIYSRQAPGGIMGPVLDDVSQVDDILEAVVDEVFRQLERL